MKENTKKKNVGTIAVIAALATAAAMLMLVVAVSPIQEMQQAFADTSGCSPGNSGPGSAFFNSGKKCFKPGNSG